MIQEFDYLDKFLKICPQWGGYHIVKLEGYISEKNNWNHKKEDDYLTTAKVTVITTVWHDGMSTNSVYHNNKKGPYFKKNNRKIYLNKFK